MQTHTPEFHSCQSVRSNPRQNHQRLAILQCALNCGTKVFDVVKGQFRLWYLTTYSPPYNLTYRGEIVAVHNWN